MRPSPRQVIRELVVRASDQPGFRGPLAAVYVLVVRRVPQAFGDIAGVEAVLLRGSARAVVHPGLSDVDLVVVLEEDLSATAELRAIQAIHRGVSRINFGAPLVQDVHIVTREELATLFRLGDPLALRIIGGTRALVGAADFSSLSENVVDVRWGQLREAFMWVERGVAQLMNELPETGARLAARSFDKAATIMDALRDESGDSMAFVQRVLHMPRQHTRRATWSDALHALGRLDDFVSEARPVSRLREAEPRGIPAHVVSHVRGWMGALAGAEAITHVVVSAEAGVEHDVRILVAIDPTHATAPAALGALGARLRHTPVLPPGYYSRSGAPTVVTAKQLRRAGYVHWSATEPWNRAACGVCLAGDWVQPAGADTEMLYGLARMVAHAPVRTRTLCGRPAIPRRVNQWRDLVFGLLGSAHGYLATGTLPFSAEQARTAARTAGIPESPSYPSGDANQLRLVREHAREVGQGLLQRVIAPGVGTRTDPLRGAELQR